MGLNVNKRGFLERIARALEKARDEELIGGKVSVDSEMSDTSENPVQNKVIKEYVDQNAGGDSNVFLVTFIDDENGTVTCDKTYEEIYEAIGEGKYVSGVKKTTTEEYNNFQTSWQVSTYDKNSYGLIIEFSFSGIYEINGDRISFSFLQYIINSSNEITTNVDGGIITATTIFPKG